MSKKQPQQPEENQLCAKCPDCQCEPCKCGKECACDKSAADWENIAKRALADLDNYKKQQEKLRGELTQFMNMALLVRFLEVYNDLMRITEAAKGAPDGITQGLENILKKFNEVFRAEGLEKIEVKPGDKFNPETMEAISHEDHDEHKDDTVIEQFESGLKYKNQIIKPVKVRVGR